MASLFCLGGLWLCEEDRRLQEDVDVLWNARVRRSRDHPQQGPRRVGRLLVPGNPDVRAADGQVRGVVSPHWPFWSF